MSARAVTAAIVALAFSLWLSWAVGPLWALIPLVLTVWLVKQAFRPDPKKALVVRRITLGIIIAALVIGVLICAWLAWISTFEF